MPYTDLDVCNLAIGRISGDRIDEIGEESPLGVFCEDNYVHVKEVVLGKYRWTFANRIMRLARLEIDPGEITPCAFKFARPADLAGAVHDWRDSADPMQKRQSLYVLETNGFFWCDEAVVFAEYTAAVPETGWPTWFRQLVVTAFAADLADNAQLRTQARDLRSEAWGTPSEGGEGGLYAQARNEDARMAPQRQLVSGVDAGPLVAARSGSTSPFHGRGWSFERPSLSPPPPTIAPPIEQPADFYTPGGIV